jgi:hypothetical protein
MRALFNIQKYIRKKAEAVFCVWVLCVCVCVNIDVTLLVIHPYRA